MTAVLDGNVIDMYYKTIGAVLWQVIDSFTGTPISIIYQESRNAIYCYEINSQSKGGGKSCQTKLWRTRLCRTAF